jgi:hypothetical protein
MSACAAGDDPAFTTVPAPSLPQGIDWSNRAAHHRHRTLENLRGENRTGRRARLLCGFHIDRAQEEGNVGRIDRRRFDADDDFVGAGLGCRDRGERYLKDAGFVDEGPDLQTGFHVVLLPRRFH